ncbi:SGNH/GDSL hydrolase family protein [Myxococcus landrumensis]|uniref:SGNH hydrolase-type esterase domain-containing protein n=1 Tax=Myxococcus landrumensis TaxID=2813577 RepID=A0ABX7N6D3_9BACT|nr:SGNH/GDSL hydrolase family protein [Myxococcus landrumus]QSQ14031.1 hypothetical protein JY572_37915 [Myxococcus landrumus]
MPPSPLPPRPTLGGWGDSILAGSCNGTDPLTVTRNLLGAGWLSSNHGVPSETAAQIRARYLSESPTGCLGEMCEHVVVEGGVNSLNNAVSPAATVADMVAVVDDALAQGHWVVWTDVLPATGCNFCGQEMRDNSYARNTTYNALMLAECNARSSNPRLRCVFNFSAFEDPARPNQGYLLPAYDCDGIHLLQAGADALAASIDQAIRQMRGL